MMTRVRFLVALALLALAAPALAQQQPARAAQQQQALVVTAQNRTAVAAKRADAAVRPGDMVRYKLTFTNVAGRQVRGVALANPLPQGMRFVAGSASSTRNDARLEYSIDGGRTFSAQPVVEVVVDGRTVRRPAPPEQYTHVRWTVDGWVAPGATVVAEFDARLGAPAPAGAAAGPAAGNRGGR